MTTPITNSPRPLASRRQFIKIGAAAGSSPFILPSSVWSQEKEAAPSERITMGFVGMGIQNRGLMSGFLGQPGVQVVAVCDVDTTRRNSAKAMVEDRYKDKAPSGWKGCDAYNDFRELIARDDIDAVCIATPDHWHAIITVAALNSGKDVYCEKPLTHNIDEAIAVMQATEKNGRVLQTGSMQRSMKEFPVACELVRNGAIGKIDKVTCNFGGPGIPCDLPEEESEQGLDWNFWLGPGPTRPYNSVLSPRGVHGHFPNWRSYKDYGGGSVSDFGAHHLDIAQWGLGMDDSGPVKVIPAENWQTATNGAVLVYANGIKVHHGGDIAARFFGSEGEVAVDRGRFEFKLGGKTISRFFDRADGGSLDSKLARVEKEYLKDAKVSLYRSSNHLTDFLSCVRSRKQPNCHAGIGGRTAICCHLTNMTYYQGETIAWDPEKLAFADGTGKPEWLTRDYRDGWKV